MDTVLIEGPRESVDLMGLVWRAVHADDRPDEIRMHPEDMGIIRMARRNGAFVIAPDGRIADVQIVADGAIEQGLPVRVHVLK